MSGKFIKVDVLSVGHRDPYKQYKANDQAWVVAKEGEAYQVMIQNVSHQCVYCIVSVEDKHSPVQPQRHAQVALPPPALVCVCAGQVIARRPIEPWDIIFKAYVVTESIKHEDGDRYTQTCKQLVFSRPVITTGKSDGGRMVDVRGTRGLDNEMGCIRVEVYDVRTYMAPPSNHWGGGMVVREDGMREAANHVDGNKRKGAFRTTTALGGNTTVRDVFKRCSSSSSSS